MCALVMFMVKKVSLHDLRFPEREGSPVSGGGRGKEPSQEGRFPLNLGRVGGIYSQAGRRG